MSTNSKNISSLSLKDLKERFEKIRMYTKSICIPLNIEDYIPQPVSFASPPKWHLAHTTWFFETLFLQKFNKDYQVFHPQYNFLFNSYYNSLGNRIMRENRGSITRPTVAEVYEYRDYVDEQVIALLDQEKLSNSALEIFELGLHHEQQHQELLIADLKHTFGHNPAFPIYRRDFYPTEKSNLETNWVSIPEGIYEIGHRDNSFCYDNELGLHKVFLHSYEICQALVTNGDYLEFINAGAYENPEYWHDEGWAWVQKEQVKAPLYWHKIDNTWKQYTLGGLIDVNKKSMLSHVSFYEASAFAEWKKMRLPTEQEWEIASSQLPYGQRWEWTNSAYLPYPGFKKASGAIGEYNGKFMVNQMVLRGSSVATSENHSRHTYRNFFHTHYRWQYTGIRLVKTNHISRNK